MYINTSNINLQLVVIQELHPSYIIVITLISCSHGFVTHKHSNVMFHSSSSLVLVDRFSHVHQKFQIPEMQVRNLGWKGEVGFPLHDPYIQLKKKVRIPPF